MRKHYFWGASLILLLVWTASACSPAPAPAPAPTVASTPQAAPVLPQPTPSPSASPSPEALSRAASTAPDQAIILKVWHPWGAKELVAIHQVLEDYQSTHPGVQIELSAPSDMATAVDVAIPIGEGPDLIVGTNDEIAMLADKGNIVALDDRGIPSGLVSDLFEPAAAAGVIWKEKVWALPVSQTSLALVYNKELVKEEYLPKDPLDFADLSARATQFQADTGQVLVCNPGFGGSDPNIVEDLSPIFFGFGIPAYVDGRGKGYLDTPEALNAAKWLSKFAQISLGENSAEICRADFKDGKVGMWWTGPESIDGIVADEINFGILPMGKPQVKLQVLMLTRNAVDRGHDRIAVDLIRYLTSHEVQKKLSLLNQTIPTLNTVVEDADIGRDPVIAGFAAALKMGVPTPPSPSTTGLADSLESAVQAIWSGSQTPEDALKAAQAAIEPTPEPTQ